MRACRPAMLRADAVQAKADRELFKLSEVLVPDKPFTLTSARHVEESLHLGTAYGGIGHKRMWLEAHNCRAGNVCG